jgi:hypothetical protein
MRAGAIPGGRSHAVKQSSCVTFVHALIDGRDFFNPASAVGMFQVENCFGRPVKVIGDEGYLLVQRLEGVAYNPPTPFNST